MVFREGDKSERKKRKNENHELKKLLKKVLAQKKPSPIDPIRR